MINELKKFIEKQIKNAEVHAKYADEVYNYRAIAYGALLFADDNKLIDVDNYDWWDDYWIQFQNIVTKIYENNKIT